MKSIFAFIVLAAAGLSVSAQEPTPAPKPVETPAPVVEKKPESKITEPTAVCDLAIQYSPIIHGLQLGMTEGEAGLKLRSQFEADPADSTRKRLTAKLEKDVVFENVESASLTSINGRVSSIRLAYNSKFPTVKDFVWTFGPRLGLIRIGFRLDEERREARTVCKDFAVDMKATDTGSELVITDTRKAAPAAIK